MKVLCLTYEYPPIGGGGSTCISSINENLGEGLEVTVLTTGFPGVPGEEQKGNIRIKRLACLRSARFRASLLSMGVYAARAGLSSLRPMDEDIIHAYFAVPSGVPGYLYKKVQKKPFVASILGGDIYDPDRSAFMDGAVKTTVGRVLKAADKVTAVSNDLRARTLEVFDGEVEVVPNAVDAQVFSPGPEMKDDEKKLRILSVGRLVKRKNYRDLIEAFGEAAPEDAELTIIGGGPEKEALQAQAEKAGLGGRVVFPGYVDLEALVGYYRKCDVFAMTSTYEGQGRTILEAMACGKPVVAPDVGGIPDAVGSGRTGILYPPGDMDSLRGALQDLLSDEKKRITMGISGRERILEGFEITRTAKKMAAIYGGL